MTADIMHAIKLIDTHCHLDAAEFDADRSQVIARASEAGVTTIVVPAVTRENFSSVIRLGHQQPGCQAALGLHPMYISAHRPAHLAALRADIKRHHPLAVGEIGLDFFVPNLDVATQEYYFIEQLKIARDFELPVLVHSRRANDQVLKQLRRFGIRRGISHAFSGSRQQADALIRQGFKLGFGGAMTYGRALNLRRLAGDLPLEAIVLETDAPDMPPCWVGPLRNSPEQLPRIAGVLAEIRDLTPEEIAFATTRNARDVLSFAA